MAGSGLMNKMRDKTHIILIILVLAFLATIVFEWGMNYLGLRGGQMSVEFGSVNGQDISYQEFQNQLQMAIDQQKQQSGQDPDEATTQMIRDQVWDQMVNQILIQQEIQKLGIKVTDQEILNWVYNSPQTLPDPIKRNFIDSTGNFNMAVYQQALATKTPEVTKFWSQVETYLKQILLSQKLQSVITGTVRVSENDVLQKYKDENIIAAFDYIFQDVNAIPDNEIQVTDNDLKNYYDKHKDDFKIDESVKMKYVLFPDNPTDEDSALTEKQLLALRKELKRYPEGDSDLVNLVNTNSVTKYSDKYLKPNELAPEVTNFLIGAKKDSVSDVIKASDGYHLVKMFDSKPSDETFTNASHILIKFGNDTNAAKLKAEEIMKRIKEGENFEKLASSLSEDEGSKVKGGNLGWFSKGTMVKEFEEAVANAKIGEVVGPIKTQFGFHIIKVNDRVNKTFKAADIKKVVTASGRTKDAAKKRADDFAYVAGKGNFDEQAKEINLQVMEVPAITKDSFIPGAGQNKSVSKFAFSESKNSVSDPIKIQGGYAVYQITEKIPAGYMNFDEIKNTVLLPRVKAEKKLDLLKQSMMDLRSKITGNDLKSLKTLNPQLNIQQADSFTVAKPYPAIGNDYAFDYELYKLKDGQISEPIRTQRGYYLVQMLHVTPFDSTKFKAQFDSIRNSLLEQKKQDILQEWISDLRDKAKIVDNRDKYFR